MPDTDAANETATRIGALVAYLFGVVLLLFASQRHAGRDARDVVLTRAEIDARLEGESHLRGHALSGPEREEVVRNFVEETVLLREAIRRRLDRDDPLIRRTLLGAMATELGEDVPDPSAEELEAYYAASRDRYATMPSVAFDNILFPPGATLPPVEQALAALRAGRKPEGYRASFTIPEQYRNATRLDLVQLYGAPFADRMLALAEGDWHGPIESSYGTHYVRVAGRRPSVPRPYAEVRDYVRQDWFAARQMEALAESLDTLAETYDVKIEGEVR